MTELQETINGLVDMIQDITDYDTETAEQALSSYLNTESFTDNLCLYCEE